MNIYHSIEHNHFFTIDLHNTCTKPHISIFNFSELPNKIESGENENLYYAKRKVYRVRYSVGKVIWTVSRSYILWIL